MRKFSALEAVCVIATAGLGCTGNMGRSTSNDHPDAPTAGAGPAQGGRPAGTAGTSGVAGTPPTNGGAGAAAAGSSGAAGSLPNPAVIGTGILDCPAVSPPPYTLVPAGGTLWYRFQSTCAGCHGPGGVGRPGYPAIPGNLTADQFKTIVRQGKGTNMPAFDATAISDADIAADFAALKAGTASGTATVANGRSRPDTWTPDKRAQVLKRGVELLRKPDRYGTACANCHSPDAIELAVIAFTDDDVLRRALQHLSPEEGLDLVDYVHAMRDQYKVTATCSKLWRPFQPGGEPLPGATVQERELAFARELDKRKLLIVTKPIASYADARAAADEIEAVSLRKLPVGVKFPRWSEDAFNGPEHRSFNDWMPGAGRVPKNPTSWYAMHDKYLADPTIQNLAAIHGAIEDQTTLSKADSHGRAIDANYSTTYDAQGWMEEVLRIKHESVLLGAHFFRLALLGQPGWFERPALPFPELNRDYGPFFHQGLQNAESPCYSNKECDAEVVSKLPVFMKEEFSPSDTVTSMSMDVLSDPWSYLGQLQDHSLLTAENFRGPTQDGHYWNLFTFDHRMVQQPFFSTHRLITQEAYATKYRGTDKFPVTGGGLPKGVHPMLHGDWIDVQGIELGGGAVADNDPRWAASLFLRANAALLFTYLQRELLTKGEPVGQKAKFLDTLDQFRVPSQELAKHLQSAAWAAANPRLKDNAAIFVTGAVNLFDEVQALAKAAPEAPAGGQ